jgi:hypothetical protein
MLKPLSRSPALDQGNSSGISSDQRGQPRPYTNSFVTSIPLGGDRSDVGAFEVGQPSVNIQLLGSTVVLNWPNYYDNFAVQTNGSVTALTGWGTLPGTPTILGTQYIENYGPISGTRFFRLKSNWAQVELNNE